MMAKELRRNPRTGKLEEVTADQIRAEERSRAQRETEDAGALQRKENLDRLVMKKSAADKLYPTTRRR